MKNKLLIIMAMGLFGCTTPYHYTNTAGKSLENLATLSFSANEVKLHTLDGKKFTGDNTNGGMVRGYGSDFYINPGKHRALISLNWSTMMFINGIAFTSRSKNHTLKNLCFDTKKGYKYHIKAINPGPKWEAVMLTTNKSGKRSSKKLGVCTN